jgi:hypothetical protein
MDLMVRSAATPRVSNHAAALMKADYEKLTSAVKVFGTTA